MKKHSKLAAVILLAFALCISVFAACKKGNIQASVTLKTPSVSAYHVGDNVDMYDFIELNKKFDYSFGVSKEGEDDSTEVVGRTYYAASSGKYTAHITAKSGESTDTKTVNFNVYEAVPFILVKNPEQDVNFRVTRTVEYLISGAGIWVKANDYKTYCDYATYYEYAEGEGKVLRLDGEATAGEFAGFFDGNSDGYYDGKTRVKFVKEGIYVFHAICENSGGISDATFTVNVSEDFSDVETIADATLEYDKQTKVAAWNVIADAADYRVKVDRKEVIIPASQADGGKITLDITPHLVSAFQDFTLVVTPRKADGTVIGKMEKYVIIAPDKYGDMVLSRGTKYDASEDDFTLNGRYATSLGWKGIRDSLDNTYVAWDGDYGLNTFVEFEFTGNNMPQLCFFADKINGDITRGYDADPNSGILLLSGVYGQIMTNQYRLFWGDKLIVCGPNRFACGGNGIIWALQTEEIKAGMKMVKLDEYPLLTQEGLENAGNAEYRLVAGTYNNGGNVYINLQLYNKQNGKAIYNLHIDTGISSTVISSGNIIAFGEVKGANEKTAFKVTKAPYVSEPLLEFNGREDMRGSGATPVGNDGVVLKGKTTGGAYKNDNNQQQSYIAFKGNYGIGNYIDFTFKGNNMPQVMFFADNINGNFTSDTTVSGGTVASGKGMLIMNGIFHQEAKNEDNSFKYPDGDPGFYKTMQIWGPDRVEANLVYGTPGDDKFPGLKVKLDGIPFTQEALRLTPDTEYKYTAGTYEENDTVWVYLRLYKIGAGGKETLIGMVNENTGIATSAITQDMSNIILYPTFKGAGKDTSFTYSDPRNTNEKPDIMVSGTTFNEDGSVTLAGKLTNGGLNNDNNKQQNFIGLKGNYGVGTYVDFTFTGNNMPQIMFFADNINGNFTSKTVFEQAPLAPNPVESGKGMLIFNGLDLSSDHLSEDLQIWGPNRVDGNIIWSVVGNADYPGLKKRLRGTPFTQNKLKEEPDAKYKYTAGTYEENDTVWVYLRLYKIGDGGKETLIGMINEDTGIAVSAITPEMCNIIMYPTFRGNTVASTTFAYSNIRTTNEKPDIMVSGAAFNEDGSVTLTGRNTYGAKANAANKTQNYVAFKGNYGVGTYVEFEFKGNNMPELMFFADNINGDFTDSGGKGMLIFNGMKHDNLYAAGAKIRVWGLDRMNTNYDGGTQYQDANAQKFGQTELSKNPDVRFKYVAGTYEKDGKIWLDMTLYKLEADETTWTQVGKIEENTNLDVSAVTSDMCNIIAYNTFKGDSSVDQSKYAAGDSCDTTFSYSLPYTKTQNNA